MVALPSFRVHPRASIEASGRSGILRCAEDLDLGGSLGGMIAS
jgi:hypothetical protein